MNTLSRILHPELLTEDGADSILRDDRKDSRQSADHQAETAACYTPAPEHEKMHDQGLSNLRQKRDREMHTVISYSFFPGKVRPTTDHY